MDIKLHEITNLGEKIMNSKRQMKGKLGHVVQFALAISSLCADLNAQTLLLGLQSS